MSKFDRYLLSQFLALFGFFSLVLVAVYWVNRAVGLFDQLIADGQSALVFVEFSLLTLPNVIRMVLPISAFAACVYAVNRLMQDSELVVMQATGFSAFRLARPVLYFGIVVFAMQMVLTNILVPASTSRMAERTAELNENLTARFIQAGQFMHPAEGITLYIREISPLGELRDIFLADERDTQQSTTYSARKAYVVRSEMGPRIVMLDGMIQRLPNAEPRRMALTRFADYTITISDLTGVKEQERPSLREIATVDLLRASPEAQKLTGASTARMYEEGHSRIASAFLGLVVPLVGFAALMLGGFSRFGLWRQMAFAAFLLIVLQMINTAASAAAIKSDQAWPMVYLASVIGAFMAILMLWLAGMKRRVKAPSYDQGDEIDAPSTVRGA